MGSSPHTRGAPGSEAASDDGAGIIPAYAGSTSRSHQRRPAVWDHPRIRGEHRAATRHQTRKNGSSPHTRGAPALDVGGAQPHGIIPAYAGSTAAPEVRYTSDGDHPRIRGEHAACVACVVSCPWIIPAYAGSTCLRMRSPSSPRDHPRIRGEHDPRRGARDGGAGSSPHTRGARLRQPGQG